MPRHLGISGGLAIVLGVLSQSAGALPDDGILDQQRAAFREAYAAAELGDWQVAAAHRTQLESYVLWPDLRAAWLKTQLGAIDMVEINAFLDRYQTLRPARDLRYHLAMHLAATGRFDEFLGIYRSFYQGQGVARLDCLAVHAEILGGHARRVVHRAIALWLVGHSQADECDPVFDYLRGAGLLGDALYAQRYELALRAGQYGLASYLARSLSDAALDDAQRWLEVSRDPLGFMETRGVRPTDAGDRERTIAAVTRIAQTDARRAEDYWRALQKQPFTDDQAVHMARHIALWLARQHETDALSYLHELPQPAVDDEVRRWRVRSALFAQDWREVMTAVDAMPAGERDAEEWRYWRAYAALQRGDRDAAVDAWTGLAAERSYYGFLAADALGREYAYRHVTIPPDTDVLARLADRPSLIRARELFRVGLESRGRAEWDDAVAPLTADEKVQAAILAHRWGWHSRAIATVATAGRFDDLEIRYPLAYADEFTSAAASASIPDSWAFGVARSESLFIPDIRSRAGAVGIMQLLPATGRLTAGEIDLPYLGLPTLTDPVSNIRLGTSYLGKMLHRFGDSRVVATAAYNAGPSRVEQWLPSSSALDARIWIENIPFNETRNYVRRVLFSDAIFNWRLTGRTRRLSESLGAIGPSAQQLASSPAPRAEVSPGVAATGRHRSSSRPSRRDLSPAGKAASSPDRR